MGFLDRAKKLAEQAKEAADQAVKLAEQAAGKAGDALADASNRAPAVAGPAPPAGAAGPVPPAGAGGPAPQYGTPYVPGMLRRPGWRERGLTDPAALLPIQERDRVGVPHSTKSQILEEPFGMGRRWSSGGRSTGVFYQLYPEHQAWTPPGGKAAFPGMPGRSAATLPDGRVLVFLGGGRGPAVVLEITGLDDSVGAELARIVSARLASA